MANGWDGDQTSFVLHQKTNEDRAAAARAADVVVFHRPDNPKKLELARVLKGIGKKIVFDNDDTFHDDGGFMWNEYMDEERYKQGLKSMSDTLDAFITEADLVTASTDILRDEYSILNKNTVTLPNCIDPFLFDEPLRNEGEKVRVGVVGSIAVTDDLKVLRPILEQTHERDDIEWVIFSLPPAGQDEKSRKLYSEEYKFFDSINVEWQPFVPFEDYYRTLNELRLDIMVIPRADTYFNRCKSNVKFLEASMLELPVIAQGFPTGDSPYERDPDDAKHMIIVKDNDEWVDTINELAKDKEKRADMGIAARRYVEDRYNIDNNAHLWQEAYEKLFVKND
jgi:glycosyltransferase involved in cell wall biosynthesis